MSEEIKKESLSEKLQDAADKTGAAIDEAGKTIKQEAGETFDKAKQDATEAFEQVKKETGQVMDTIAEGADKLADAAKDAFGDLKAEAIRIFGKKK